MSRGLISVVLFAAVALVPGACSRSSDPHQIGHLAPRSGPDAAAGQRLATAVAIVVEEANHDEANRVEQRPITVVHADTGPEPDGFSFQATRLIAINKVSALIGGVNSRQLAKITAAVQAENAAPITVSPCGGLAGAPSQIVWGIGLSPGERGKYLARCAAEHLKLTEIVTITDSSNPVFEAIRTGFEGEFRNDERAVSSQWSYADPKELTGLVAKLTASPRKAVLFCGRATDLLQFRGQLRATTLPDSVIYLFGGEEEEGVLRQDAARSNGVVYASAFNPSDSGEKVQKFITDYRNRTSELPDADAALTADATRILIAAAGRAKSFRREFLLRKEELFKLEIELPTGPFWFTREGEPRRTAFVLRIDSSQPRLLATYRPEKK